MRCVDSNKVDEEPSPTKKGQQEQSFRELLIFSKELNKCDKLDLHLLGKIKGGSVNLICISDSNIVAVDANVIGIPFFWSQQQQMHGDKQQHQATFIKYSLSTPLASWISKHIYQRLDEGNADDVPLPGWMSEQYTPRTH